MILQNRQDELYFIKVIIQDENGLNSDFFKYLSKKEFKEIDIEQWKKLGKDKAIDMDLKGIITRNIHPYYNDNLQNSQPNQ